MLGLGFSATSEISALPRLERQDNVVPEELFDPWMVVEDRKRRIRRTDIVGKSSITDNRNSRFDILHGISEEGDNIGVRHTSVETSKQSTTVTTPKVAHVTSDNA
ncbi:hypothetical protein V6N13_055172 [Hibiscus sabdariffa]